jgi:hypothetical protein
VSCTAPPCTALPYPGLPCPALLCPALHQAPSWKLSRCAAPTQQMRTAGVQQRSTSAWTAMARRWWWRALRSVSVYMSEGHTVGELARGVKSLMSAHSRARCLQLLLCPHCPSRLTLSLFSHPPSLQGGAVIGGYNPLGFDGYGPKATLGSFLFTWPDGDWRQRPHKLPKVCVWGVLLHASCLFVWVFVCAQPCRDASLGCPWQDVLGMAVVL